MIDVRAVIVESDQKVIRNVDVSGLNLVDNPLSQIEDRILVRLDRSRRVDQERQRRIDDVLADGDRTLHAVASDASTGAGSDAIGVTGAGAAFAQARL